MTVEAGREKLAASTSYGSAVKNCNGQFTAKTSPPERSDRSAVLAQCWRPFHLFAAFAALKNRWFWCGPDAGLLLKPTRDDDYHNASDHYDRSNHASPRGTKSAHRLPGRAAGVGGRHGLLNF